MWVTQSASKQLKVCFCIYIDHYSLIYSSWNKQCRKHLAVFCGYQCACTMYVNPITILHTWAKSQSEFYVTESLSYCLACNWHNARLACRTQTAALLNQFINREKRLLFCNLTLSAASEVGISDSSSMICWFIMRKGCSAFDFNQLIRQCSCTIRLGNEFITRKKGVGLLITFCQR